MNGAALGLGMPVTSPSVCLMGPQTPDLRSPHVLRADKMATVAGHGGAAPVYYECWADTRAGAPCACWHSLGPRGLAGLSALGVAAKDAQQPKSKLQDTLRLSGARWATLDFTRIDFISESLP